jgi:transcriptional regulator with XRE-family HTH domain
MPKQIKPMTVDERIVHKSELLGRLDKGEIELGQAIREMREGYAGLTQKKFAELAKISMSTLSAVEKDADSANVRTLKKILTLFGMTISLTNKFSKPKIDEH